MRRPSNVLCSTSCIIWSLSISSWNHLRRTARGSSRKGTYLVSRREICLVDYRILLILSIMVCNCLQKTVVKCCCAFIRVASQLCFSDQPPGGTRTKGGLALPFCHLKYLSTFTVSRPAQENKHTIARLRKCPPLRSHQYWAILI